MKKNFHIVLYVVIVCFGISCAFFELNDSELKHERITNGTISLVSLYPFAASLVYQRTHRCGASIIAKTWALTAGHCCISDGREISDYYLYVAVGNIYWKDGDYYKVTKKFIHEEYDDKNLINDIALLKLRTPIKFGLSVSPIALHPNAVTASTKNPDVAVVGWGLYTDGSGTLSSRASHYLQYVDVRVIPLEKCEQFYSPITPGNMCIFGGHHKGSCEGDSGGPLIMHLQKWVQIGIVSYGADCTNVIPEVYTSISYYYPWIQKVLRA